MKLTGSSNRHAGRPASGPSRRRRGPACGPRTRFQSGYTTRPRGAPVDIEKSVLYRRCRDAPRNVAQAPFHLIFTILINIFRNILHATVPRGSAHPLSSSRTFDDTPRNAKPVGKPPLRARTDRRRRDEPGPAAARPADLCRARRRRRDRHEHVRLRLRAGGRRALHPRRHGRLVPDDGIDPRRRARHGRPRLDPGPRRAAGGDLHHPRPRGPRRRARPALAPAAGPGLCPPLHRRPRQVEDGARRPADRRRAPGRPLAARGAGGPVQRRLLPDRPLDPRELGAGHRHPRGADLPQRRLQVRPDPARRRALRHRKACARSATTASACSPSTRPTSSTSTPAAPRRR